MAAAAAPVASTSSPPDALARRRPAEATTPPIRPVAARSLPGVADQSTDARHDHTLKSGSNPTTEPLAPPPRPAPGIGSTPDYFSVAHSGHLSYETNPFEHSFGGGSGPHGDLRTPGGTKLPSVAALTSPSGGLGGSTPGFWSLRSGPLSPAMLSGPQKEDYFSDSHHLRGGFPTPNESSLRSGLTPGGGGSMFPEPSPNTQAYLQMTSGAATPSTLDFHRTAVSAAAAQKRELAQPPSSHAQITSQPPPAPPNSTLDPKPSTGQFDQHDANDAANGLFLLAQTSAARNGAPAPSRYAMAPQNPVHNHVAHHGPGGGSSAEASPHPSSHRAPHGSTSTASGRGASEMSGMSDENEAPPKAPPRGKGKRTSTATRQTYERRKAEETPSKAPAIKKMKIDNASQALSPEPPSEEEPDMSKDEYGANGKKMTDDEKRKNFLERNRVAALKCRQRKKQWLANLQHKVEVFSTENDALNSQINALRDEVVNLKTLLLAHKDCPITQQQGLAGLHMQQMIDNGAYGAQMNPYGMAGMQQQPPPPQQQQQQVLAGQGTQRRYS